MILVIMLLVLCNLLHSDCASNKDNKVKIKFPRPILHASSVIISGTLNVTASTLQVTITGRELQKEEECVIDIKPQLNLIYIGGKDITYEFLSGQKDIVPFTFTITALSNEDEKDTLHVEFNGNDAGAQALDNPCSFKSFSAVDRILFHGFKHIRSLTFMYEEDGSNDYF